METKTTNISVADLIRMTDKELENHCFSFPQEDQWINKTAYQYALHTVGYYQNLPYFERGAKC